MTKITLNVVSRGLYIINMFGTLILAMILTFSAFDYLPIELNKLVFVGIFAGLWYLVSRFTKKLPKGQVSLEITNDGLVIEWIKQFHFHSKLNNLLKWEEISDYMFQPEQYFNLFRIRTKDKRKFKFSMNENNSDFSLFYESFEKLSKSKSNDNSVEIVRAKNIYESNYGLVAAIILGILLIVGVIVILTVKPKGDPNYGLLIASLIGGVLFIIQVINHRRKSKNK